MAKLLFVQYVFIVKSVKETTFSDCNTVHYSVCTVALTQSTKQTHVIALCSSLEGKLKLVIVIYMCI